MNKVQTVVTAVLRSIQVKKPRGRRSIEKLIDDRICNQFDRDLLKRRLCDGITYEELADEFGYSVTGIKKRIYKAMKQLNSCR